MTEQVFAARDSRWFHRLATEAYRAGRVGAARVAIRRSVLLGPEMFRAAADHLVIHGEEISKPARQKWDDRLLILNGAYPASLRRRARGFLETRDFRRAIDAWRRTILVEPRTPGDLISLTVAVSRVGSLSSCMKCFAWAHVLGPNNAATLFSWATALFNTREFGRAEKLMRRVLASGTPDPKVHLWMGRIVHAQGRRGDAVRHLDAATRADPSLERPARMVLRTVLPSDHEPD